MFFMTFECQEFGAQSTGMLWECSYLSLSLFTASFSVRLQERQHLRSGCTEPVILYHTELVQILVFCFGKNDLITEKILRCFSPVLNCLVTTATSCWGHQILLLGDGDGDAGLP